MVCCLAKGVNATLGSDKKGRQDERSATGKKGCHPVRNMHVFPVVGFALGNFFFLLNQIVQTYSLLHKATFDSSRGCFEVDVSCSSLLFVLSWNFIRPMSLF